MILAVIIFIIGIILVVKGGDWFVDAASWIAKALGVPPFIIGATIVSIATTLPEMIVSTIAALEGKNDMAIGNAVGSVTANTGMIMALAMIFLTVRIDKKKYIRQFVLLLAAAAALWVGSATGTLQPWASVLLVAIFLIYVVISLQEAKKEMTESKKIKATKNDIIKNVALFAVGAAAIVIGSNFLINSGTKIAIFLGVPERVIAVTMVAIGTSLPELVTTITAIRKKESHLSIGNIIGANIIDLSLILPICAGVSSSSFTVSYQCYAIDMPVCFVISLFAILPLAFKGKAYKIQGILLLVMYFAYLLFTTL